MRFKKFLYETVYGKLPKGWDKSSVEKLSKKIGKKPNEKGFFDACVSKMQKHIGSDKVKGFCANVKDVGIGSTYWRGKNKKKKEIKMDVKKHPLK